MLEQERRYYADHADEWAKAHSGKFLVVKGEELVGFFDSLDEALAVGASKFGLTSFLVRQVGARVEAVQVPALTLGLLRADPNVQFAGQGRSPLQHCVPVYNGPAGSISLSI